MAASMGDVQDDIAGQEVASAKQVRSEPKKEKTKKVLTKTEEFDYLSDDVGSESNEIDDLEKALEE